MYKIVFFLILLAFPVSTVAIEIAGVRVPENLDTDLQLNGAGIRSKLFFKIYVAQLYLEHPSHDAAVVLDDTGRKRMVMHILYDEVTKEKLVAGWNDGFQKNLSEKQLQELASDIKRFNDLFVDVHTGDQIILDYRANTGTEVTIAGKIMGTIPGADFNRALLSLWLGEKPVTTDLRQELLGR